jgi:ribosome-associated heat shock protein Hsp15
VNDRISPADRHRLDKWLWCVRFYKTRALAARAVSGGKVKVNGERARPSHNIRVGDRVSLSLAPDAIDVDVLAFPARRGSAIEAQASYVETPESQARRDRYREQRQMAKLSRPQPVARPDKRERRQLAKLRRGHYE